MPSTKDAEDVETVYDEYTVYSGDINSLQNNETRIVPQESPSS
jgi:hypothetical protein